MTSYYVSRTIIGALVVAVLGAAVPVWGGEEHSAAQAKEAPSESMVTSYAGPINAHVGDFSGKLVCLRCDIKPGPDAMRQCQKKGHRHALSMDSDAMIHPLLAGTPAVLEQINSGELHDKKVTVHGKYYPSTGFILVDRIELAKKSD